MCDRLSRMPFVPHTLKPPTSYSYHYTDRIFLSYYLVPNNSSFRQ